LADWPFEVLLVRGEISGSKHSDRGPKLNRAPPDISIEFWQPFIFKYESKERIYGLCVFEHRQMPFRWDLISPEFEKADAGARVGDSILRRERPIFILQHWR
jgi:hypothetical protein